MEIPPLTCDDWLKIASEKEQAAMLLLKDASVARQTWMLCGEAAECLLKAFIMRSQRLNAWPEKPSKLHTHDIRTLTNLANIQLQLLTAAEVAAFSKAMEWRREHDYCAIPFPLRDAKDMHEAVFGKEGVSNWIRSNL